MNFITQLLLNFYMVQEIEIQDKKIVWVSLLSVKLKHISIFYFTIKKKVTINLNHILLYEH